MNSIQQHLSLLGLRVQDVVTGFVGVPSTIAFEVSGSIQAIVTPRVDEKGEPQKTHWYDVKRLHAAPPTKVPLKGETEEAERVLPAPVFTDETVERELAWLGQRVLDRVSLLTGVVTNVGFDLYGCVAAILQPQVKPDGTAVDSVWVSTNRLAVDGGYKVKAPPFFEIKRGREVGAAEKSMPPSLGCRP